MAANVPEPTRVLSIQSHVVSGYVGNRSATFPLQLLGWEVDVVNTVQFTNHTGFGRWGGQAFDADHLANLFTGLDQNGLLRYARVLTGYCPGPDALQTVHQLIDRLRQLNPDLLYVLDPVMGDMDYGMYVDPRVLPIYQKMLPFASMITPNQFEAQALSGINISSLSTLHDALFTLHVDYHVPHVLITSVELPEEDMSALGMSNKAEDGSKLMTLVGSSWDSSLPLPTSPNVLQPWCIQFPEVEGYFSGVGDLFAALVLGRYRRPEEAKSVCVTAAPSPSISPVDLENPVFSGILPSKEETPLVKSVLLDQLHSAPTHLSRAVELAIASLQAILATTTAYIAHLPPPPTRAEWEAQQAAAQPRNRPNMFVEHQQLSTPSTQSTTHAAEQSALADKTWEAQQVVETFRRRELRVVQSRKGIEEPTVLHRARWLRPSP